MIVWNGSMAMIPHISHGEQGRVGPVSSGMIPSPVLMFPSVDIVILLRSAHTHMIAQPENNPI